MDTRLIAYKYDTDKSRLYLHNYERYLAPLTTREVRLLELGIHKGGSLLLWRDFFPSGRVVGLDLEHVDVADPTERIRIYQGDQRDLRLLDRIAAECAPGGFDVIIDDASHIAQYTKIAFWHLFEHHLKAGGIFVIEDWRVGYWDAWPDGARYDPLPTQESSWLRRLRPPRPDTSRFPSHCHGLVGFVKQLMDELGMDMITHPARNGTPPQQLPRFQRMDVCPGQVFIVKTTPEHDDLVREQLRGAPPRE